MTNSDTMKFSGLPHIIAIDFDGIIVEDAFPFIGAPKRLDIDRIKEIQSKENIKTILWTSRSGQYLDEAIKFCESVGLKFDAINENIKEVQEITGGDTRKVYANQYIDDHNNSIPLVYCMACLGEL